VLKAFGTGLRGGSLLDIEILNDELGCPRVHLGGYFAQLAQRKGIKEVWLSLSHARDYAAAHCVVEK
jgi:holo-[acyl-carrier protein] synthase